MDTTWWIIIGAVVLLIVYDIWTIVKRGLNSSISWKVWALCHDWPIIAFAVGVLCGHLFWSQVCRCL